MKKIYKMALLGIAAGIIFPVMASAQGELKKANKLYEKLDYTLAIPYYLEHFKTHEPDVEAVTKLANCYRVNNNPKEAEVWYAKAVSFKGSAPINTLYYAEALKCNGKYKEAREQFIAYGKLDPAAAERVAVSVKACDEAISWFEAPAPFTVKNEEQLNTESADFSPMIYGKGMLFASDRAGADTIKSKDNKETGIHGWSGRSYVKLYYAEQQVTNNKQDVAAAGQKGPMASESHKKEITWKDVVVLPEAINEHYHSGPASFDAKKNILYFTKTRKVKVKAGERYPDPTGWLPGTGRMHVNRLEIYSAEKNGEALSNVKPFQWNNAENYSVGHPAISPDGKTLYFSSDMPGGYGATDIYYCELKSDGSWSQPVNAGEAINTPGRESFPVMRNDGILYFSSDGHAGMGGLDLFSAKGEKESWKEVSNLRYPFNSPKDDLGIVFTTNDSAGYFSSDREGGKGWDDIYSFKALKPEVKPAPEPVKLVFPAVYYDFDKSNIRQDAAEGLDKVVEILAGNPNIKVEVSAHCDCRGSDAYNMKLSKRRVESAVSYLVEKGIDKSRLNAQGHGESQLANQCRDGIECSEADHQMNRRTEFKDITGVVQPEEKKERIEAPLKD